MRDSIPVDLPIREALPALLAALRHGTNAVLQAPPGAGKTTGVPLALLGEDWRGDGRIIMLEPRRLAARAAARRMAALLGQAVGETCGYRVRLDTKVSARTRIEVVTDGFFTRMIQDDPSLDGIAAVLFDEFHERRLETDLGLALCLDAQAALRPDLRLIAMSATLDAAPVAALMDDAPVVTSAGRSFPVEIRHLDAPATGRLGPAMAEAIMAALGHGPGDILAFLPGAAEIRQTQRALENQHLPATVLILPLQGDLDPKAQDRALARAPEGCRKIVLATSIAETSLTIDGILQVVDSGLTRTGRYDPRTGMTRLETIKVSQAGAEQRSGRAGRTAPGQCWRLWPEGQHRALERFTAPEIAAADLAPFLLELASWGIADPAGLRLLDQPGAASLATAHALLIDLGALTEDGKLTPHGRSMIDLGLHPRLAHMVLKGSALGDASLAAAIASVLAERDIAKGAAGPDLRQRLELIESPSQNEAARRAQEAARRLVRQLGHRWEKLSPSRAGMLLSLAYPDRIAQPRAQAGRLRLSSGQGAWLAADDPLAAAPFLAVADLDGKLPESRIWLAAPLDRAELESALGDRFVTEEEVIWDDAADRVQARRQTRLGALVLASIRLDAPSPLQIRAALIEGLRRRGIDGLPWSDAARSLRARIAFLANFDGPDGGWPAMDEGALMGTLEDWLGPALGERRSLSGLANIDLAQLLRHRLDWEQQRRLDLDAPTHLLVPSGSTIPVDYESGDIPVLAVRLQEMFGLRETPAVAGGRVRLSIHLLSPARRPIQVTRDLAGFWNGSYKAVRAELRGRYPRHPWPEDPLTAPPTARAKPRA